MSGNPWDERRDGGSGKAPCLERKTRLEQKDGEGKGTDRESP